MDVQEDGSRAGSECFEKCAQLISHVDIFAHVSILVYGAARKLVEQQDGVVPPADEFFAYT